MTPRVRAAGESAVVVEFGDTIDPRIVASVQRLDLAVTAAASSGRLPGIVETIPTFRSLAILLDPLCTSPDEVACAVLALGDDEAVDNNTSVRSSWSLPVLYGGTAGPDLDEVARSTGLDPAEVVRRHTERAVTVFMLGFLPGFGFLGEIDAGLRLPRKREPRVRVPAGSVAIAMTLTAVYPWESPGGWHLIGHSPVPLFDASCSSPTLLSPGDDVRFHAIGREEHAALVADRDAGILDPGACRVAGSATDPDASAA